MGEKRSRRCFGPCSFIDHTPIISSALKKETALQHARRISLSNEISLLPADGSGRAWHGLCYINVKVKIEAVMKGDSK
jgi:hypothetical protein